MIRIATGMMISARTYGINLNTQSMENAKRTRYTDTLTGGRRLSTPVTSSGSGFMNIRHAAVIISMAKRKQGSIISINSPSGILKRE